MNQVLNNAQTRELYAQLIMVKLFAETKGCATPTAFCNPFNMYNQIKLLMGDEFQTETYYDAIQYLEQNNYATYGGMYITEKGINFIRSFISVSRQLSVLEKHENTPLLLTDDEPAEALKVANNITTS
ncbi:hypothetical protein [Robertkochia aurantiaca]|uniref:hypothetical protein n=1 Tax=Robertkochia aurantiaca TaxID=2873700 RepID=UPI001CCE1618|nr:hypothetical protein [Robertkochia sp. 3YJGBD-33]